MGRGWDVTRGAGARAVGRRKHLFSSIFIERVAVFAILAVLAARASYHTLLLAASPRLKSSRSTAFYVCRGVLCLS